MFINEDGDCKLCPDGEVSDPYTGYKKCMSAETCGEGKTLNEKNFCNESEGEEQTEGNESS